MKNANKKVKWTSSNKKVVKVVKTSGKKKQNAVIQGMKKGTATVTAKVGTLKLKVKIQVTHSHSYLPATCTQPATCICGKTYGTAQGHNMSGATCQHANYCTKGCGYVAAPAAAHLYIGGSCMWCNDLDLTSVVSFNLRNTSVQGAMNVRFVTVDVTNSGNSEFVIEGTGYIRPAAGSAPIALYITDEDDNTYLRARVSSRSDLLFFYDTMNAGIRFTFLPDGVLTFNATYGGVAYQINMNMYGEYTFNRI